MLLTDRDPITIDDVTAVDPEVGEVAATEKIPTEGDKSFIHLAVMEAGNRIMSLMQNYGYPFPNQFGASGGSTLLQNGFFSPYFDSTPPPRLRLGQIVVDSDSSTFDSPLKTWIKYIALRNFFQIASNRQVNDRYEAKRKNYESDINSVHWPNLKATGIPFVNTPIPCPGAKYEVGQGVWSASNVTGATTAGTSGGTFDVAITWFSQTLNGMESAPSQTITLNVPAGEAIQVSIASLTVPAYASMWKVYAGVTGQSMYLQTSVPVATQSITLSSDPVSSGTIVGTGQPKDQDLTILNLFLRT